MSMLRTTGLAAALAACASLAAGCTSWDTATLNGDIIHIPTMKSADGKRDIASTAALWLQESCVQFNLFFIPLGTGEADCIKLFMNGFQHTGHDRVAELAIEASPRHGVWWFFDHLLGFDSTEITGIAVDTNEGGGGGGGGQ